jgi:hypothetical protein
MARHFAAPFSFACSEHSGGPRKQESPSESLYLRIFYSSKNCRSCIELRNNACECRLRCVYTSNLFVGQQRALAQIIAQP